MRRMRGVVMALGVGLAGELGAQQAARDSAVFRPGQWGNEFAAGTSFASLGVLRFRSPRAAWLANLNAGVISTSSTENGQDGDDTQVSVQVELGHRWYRALVPRIYQYASLGVLGALSRSDVEFGGVDNTQESRATTIGAFGALGATWMVTPHFSLGAQWQANVSFERTRFRRTFGQSPGPCPTSPCTDDGRTTRFNFGSGTLRAALYY